MASTALIEMKRKGRNWQLVMGEGKACRGALRSTLAHYWKSAVNEKDKSARRLAHQCCRHNVEAARTQNDRDNCS